MISSLKGPVLFWVSVLFLDFPFSILDFPSNPWGYGFDVTAKKVLNPMFPVPHLVDLFMYILTLIVSQLEKYYTLFKFYQLMISELSTK